MGSYKTEATTRPLGQMDSTHHLIDSDRVEGTAVLDREGVKLGTIERLMIDKLSGQVRYAVMSSGGFLGMGESYHPLPWGILNYNAEEGAYVVDLDRGTLEGAPHYLGSDEPDWSDRDYNVRVLEYYRVDFPKASGGRM
jgi:PRC-barrel domain